MIDQVATEAARQPQNTIQLLYMALIVIVVNVPIWIRELKKAKEFKSKNGQLDKIKATVEDTDNRTQEMDKSLGIIKTDVKNQKQHCTTTITRMEKGLQQHSDQILQLAKNGAKKT